MTEAEAMNSSALSEEEDQREDERKSSSKTAAVGEILEGKRAKKMVERLDLSTLKQTEKLRIGNGSGDKLGEIPRTSHQINKMKPGDLKPLHAIAFDRPGKMSSIKKNLRLFNGFPFLVNSEQFDKKREKLLKSSNLTNSKLKVVCAVLDLEKKGTHSDLIDRILTFLTAPVNSGKRVPVKKKKKSKKRLSGDDGKASTRKRSKPKANSSSSSPKKSKTGSKSKAIVMDSSSDEEDVKAEATAEESDVEEKPPAKEKEDVKEEKESSKAKVSREKKTSPTKRPRKKTKQEVSEDSTSDEQTKNKKPAAKTKMADSSSNWKKTSTVDDSSDDDEPLIKMIRKPPNEEKLKETVKILLEEANLEEVTMKQICQKVFDTFPEVDLSDKKDFIKRVVKELIT